MRTQMKNQDWWPAFYAETPFELFLQRKDPTPVARTVSFLIQQLKLVPGSKVFDQCCGVGSIAIPLSERGFEVIGVDLCEKFVETANSEAAVKGLQCKFVTDDAFTFTAPGPCDGAFNWWTSFGYSDSDERNMSMLQRAADSLRKGGRFALDYPNVPFVLRNVVEHESRDYGAGSDAVRIVRDTVIDLIRGTRSQKWTFIMADGTEIVHDTALRLYLPHRIKEMLESVGFVDIKFFGDIDGSPLSIDTPRCIAVGTRA